MGNFYGISFRIKTRMGAMFSIALKILKNAIEGIILFFSSALKVNPDFFGFLYIFLAPLAYIQGLTMNSAMKTLRKLLDINRMKTKSCARFPPDLGTVKFAHSLVLFAKDMGMDGDIDIDSIGRTRILFKKGNKTLTLSLEMGADKLFVYLEKKVDDVPIMNFNRIPPHMIKGEISEFAGEKIV